MQLVKWVSVGLFCGFLSVNAHASDQSESSNTNSVSEPSGASTSADNTAKNTRDRENATLTPTDQGKTKEDIQLTRNIRRALMKSDQLSMTAKNIKIITIDGKVTLRGPVKSDAERETINKLVEQQGVKSVDNQIEVKHHENQ